MNDDATWSRQNPRQRQQRMQTHHQEEGHARYFMQFTNEVLHMLGYLSAEREVATVFMLPELVRCKERSCHICSACHVPLPSCCRN